MILDFTELALSDTFRVALAMLAGGLIGLEREFRDKSAGFRMLIFIDEGSGLFSILSKNLAPAETRCLDTTPAPPRP